MTINDWCLLQPWVADDFTPCFRETFINALIPTAFLAWSLVCVVNKAYQYKKSRSSLYTPLKSSLPTSAQSYGTTTTTNNDDTPLEDDNYSDAALYQYEEKSTQWSVYSWSRLLAIFQSILYCHALMDVITGHYSSDPVVEGSDIGMTYIAQSLLWVSCSVLAVINLSLPQHAKVIADEICQQLNVLYLVHFVVGLIDLHSYYRVYDYSTVSNGYSIAFYATSISFILLAFAMNEERHAPAEPVITDTGRALSGEGWASLYSQFMFTWVNVMMKLGYKRTINEDDLVELPAANRAKNVLRRFRHHRKATILRSLAYTFWRPLLLQTVYTLVWSVMIFGPALYLNKIINYIETPDTTEPVLTAFIYVTLLFVTNVIQSLSLQQALYIGRTLGIRIQSIVIGEVFGKALRRRDTNGSTAEDEKKKEKDPEGGDINNLLSVDAQKIGELTAYIFYAYAYPIQIIICIIALYRLLGTAALWGVLVMALSQPCTYYISQMFEKCQRTVMSATDKRLKLINELLAAIKIVKFFAWEKDFRSRVVEAREVELKAIRKRLFIFMYMASSWFVIPILIMITVFYVYTLNNALSAATAFTALALFMTFRAALDEFPFVVSFIIQAGVSLGRVEAFLKEDEVDKVQQVAHPSGTHIGFVDNASFGWEDPKEAADDTSSSSVPTPILKNLNLSFPRHKLSIICGPTGCGKSTLLSSLFGETHRYSGTVVLPPRPVRPAHALGGSVSGIAYVAQTAWLQNCSIRDNILFGLDYDEERYAKVLYMTALTRDLDILEFGDQTEVGEKGVSLSGGQKQRLAIARAVYSNAETVILDDCLSAVDAHTAKHLYDHCLKGELLQNRTVILVTHYVGLCFDGASYIVALKDGEVVAAGEPNDVLKTGALGDELSHAREQKQEADEEKAEEGPIPSVPKQAKIAKTGEGSKLVKDEVRAEGGVPLSVYATYFFASGGYLFWIAIVFFFCLTEVTVLTQDYWIKVWASAYNTNGDDALPPTNGTSLLSSSSIFSASQLGSFDGGVGSFNTYAQSGFSAADTTFKDPHSVDVKYYLGVYFGIGMVALAVSMIRLHILYSGSILASRRLHSQLLDRILRAKVRFFDTTPVGRIVNRFSSDLETIDQEVSPQLGFFMFSFVATLVVVMVIIGITPAFLIPGAFIALAFWRIGAYYLKTSRDLKRINSVSRSPIYVQFNESVNGVATIRAFGCQERFVQDNYAKVDNNNRPFIWMWATNRWLHAHVDLLGSVLQLCCGIVLILSRSWVDAGLAGLSLSYALNFTNHVIWLIRNYTMNEMNMNAVERIDEYLAIEEEPAAHIPEKQPAANWPSTGSIKVEHLEVKYAPENPSVLRDVSFNVNPREKVAIVGRTGSGKSTLALSLFRFMEATQGKISIDGVDISTIGLDDLRSRLTIIPQDPTIFSGTLRSNLDPFGQYDDATLWAALKRSHLVNSDNEEGDQLISTDGTKTPLSSSGSVTSGSSSANDKANNQLTLDSHVSEGGKNFSQGQRQLIALARALTKRSNLIVLDEATSSVDFETDRRIQMTIRSEFKDSALLCVAHRLKTIIDYDRVLVLDQGQVKEFDTPFNLITKEGGIFQQMCQRSGQFNELLEIAKKSSTSGFSS